MDASKIEQMYNEVKCNYCGNYFRVPLSGTDQEKFWELEYEKLAKAVRFTENTDTGVTTKEGEKVHIGMYVDFYIGSNDFPIRKTLVIEKAFGMFGFFAPYYKLERLQKNSYAYRQSSKIENGIGYKFYPLVDFEAHGGFIFEEKPKAAITKYSIVKGLQ